MRSTKASSGFQVDPYPYNSNLQSRIHKSPAANATNQLGKQLQNPAQPIKPGTHDSRSPFSALQL
jgi:hypothetical protein